MVPFNTENAKETTTFVTLLMLEKSDGHFSMEYNSRTASNPGQAIVEVERFRDAAIGWLHTIWNDWLNGRPVDPELKEVFEAIAVDSRELLQQIEGKSRGFTEAEVKDVCADWHEADYYSRSPERNPAGPQGGLRRASRGGSWRHAYTICRVTLRSKLDPSFRYNDYGFRLARSAAAV